MSQERKARFTQKHDIEANWIKAINFIPIAGEIIIYDIDEFYPYQRIKIGDGTTLINDLPFASSRASSTIVLLDRSTWAMGEDGRYYQTVAVEQVKETTPMVIVDCSLDGTDLDADMAILDAWKLPSIHNVAQGDGSLTFYSLTPPSITIPVNVGIC